MTNSQSHPQFSLSKDKIRVLLLEGVNDTALQRTSKVGLGEGSQVHRCGFSVADFDARGLAHQPGFSASFGRKNVSGLEPWQELDWIDKEFQIDRIHVRGLARTPRCAAVNVNPDTAIRHANLPKAISQNFGHVDLGVYPQVLFDGELQVGDEVLEAMTLAKFVS